MDTKILIIDDEKDMIEVLSFRLQSCGYQVISATDGESGLKKVKSEQPNLIILDLMMPNMDGYEVARRLKADALSSSIPVIVLTAAVTPDLNSQVSKIQVAACIIKPFEPEALLETIKKLIPPGD